MRFHQLLFRIYRMIAVPRWLVDFDQLEEDLRASACEMSWFQNYLGGDWLGSHGFNTPKTHDFMNLARLQREVGSAFSGSTSIFEMTNKALKAADRATMRGGSRGP